MPMSLFIDPKENAKTTKPKGIKLKAKEICGSARPISGLEKSSHRRKKTKNESHIMAQPQPQPHGTMMV